MCEYRLKRSFSFLFFPYKFRRFSRKKKTFGYKYVVYTKRKKLIKATNRVLLSIFWLFKAKFLIEI